MDDIVDLDVAAAQVEQRIEAWRGAGIVVSEVTWRDQGEGWPPVLKTDLADVKDADSIGIALSKDGQEGEIVLFKGGWVRLRLLDRPGHRRTRTGCSRLARRDDR